MGHGPFDRAVISYPIRSNPFQVLCLRDPVAGVECSRLPPVTRECLRQAGRLRHYRSRDLDATSQVPQEPLFGALVFLSTVVGDATRDLVDVEPSRRSRNFVLLLK